MASSHAEARERRNQILLIDADDTLWETNLLYERVLDQFVAWLAPFGYERDSVRQQVDVAERRNIRLRGYGARNFLHTLEEVTLQLIGPSPDFLPSLRQQIEELGRHLLATQPEIFDGVADTLAYLDRRHQLYLFSKGQTEEQGDKIRGSGLERFFRAWEIVPEKDEAAYRELAERHHFPAGAVWMVGNSPRSDINPALAAGLNAVYIPSPYCWEYENEELRRPGLGELLVLKRFRELQDHF